VSGDPRALPGEALRQGMSFSFCQWWAMAEDMYL
jgi:hypothetical protein